MGETNVVLEAAVTENAVLHRAPYYVEYGIIHANIDGRIIIVPVADTNADNTVQGLLRQHLRHLKARLQRPAMWR